VDLTGITLQRCDTGRCGGIDQTLVLGQGSIDAQ
jgi:hypothetical protein